MNDGSNPTHRSSQKSRTYFIVGFALLLVMGLTWSLDDSFVYTSLGAAVFFFFLAYHSRQRTAASSSHRRQSTRQQAQGQGDFSSLFDSLKNKQKQHSPRPRVQSQQMENSRKFIMLVMLFIGSIFLIIILSIVLSDGPDYEATNFFNKAEEARYSGNYDSAEFYYRKVLAENPEDLNSLNGLGIISLDQQRYDMAISQFDDALKVDPDYEYARYNKALTYYYQKNYRMSLGESFNLLKRSPDYYDAMQLAGDNYYDQQRYDSAKYWYDEGYNNGVRNAWICHVLGYLYDRNNETPRAIELYREALSYDSTKVDVYVRLGELYPGIEGDFFRAKARELQQSSN